MEEPEKQHDPLMGFYFSCPHCQQKYVSAECVQEHSPNCHMQSSSSFTIPKIQSYSSLNPQALDMNFDSGGFQVRHEIIKREPEDYYAEDNCVGDCHDETEDTALSDPARDKTLDQDDAPSPQELQPRLTRQKAKILRESNETEDSNPSQGAPYQQEARPFAKILRNSVRNPLSTCTEDRYLCRYCPRTFLYRSSVHQHEAIHPQEPKYSCTTCSERFRFPDSLNHHMKSHVCDLEFRCWYPGCSRTFRHTSTRWYHHKTHPKGRWNKRKKRSSQQVESPKSNTALSAESHHFTGNDSTAQPTTDHSIQDSTTSDDKSPKNTRVTRSSNHLMTSYHPAQVVTCCYPGCPKTFKSTFKRWIHHKTHPKGRWNKKGRRLGRTLRQNQQTSKMPPKLSPQTENFDDKESTETSSMPDLSIEVPMTHSETKITNNPNLENVQQSAVNDATTNLESKDSKITPKSRGRGRPARPGYEIEIMTSWGRRFKCDLCDKMFLTRMIARDHRLGHFDEPQLPCYIKGCSQMFFSRNRRVNHLKSVHHVEFRKGKPFIGSRRAALKTTGHGKVAAKEIVPNMYAARKPSRSPLKIQLRSSKSNPNIPRGSQAGILCPEETLLSTCGICDDSFENSDALKCHILKTHGGPKESQAEELENIGAPADSENTGSVSVPDLSIEGPMTAWETNTTSDPKFENIRKSAAMNGAILLESRDSNIPRSTRRRGRPAKPGQEIEITTASGRRFQCDLCDSIFLTRLIARDHRLGHFATPQIPCYITGCTQMFFSTIQRVNHLKSVHCIRFRKKRPFFGSKRLQLKITGPRKVAAREIIPNLHAVRKPSQSPPKIQLRSSKSNKNTPGGSQIEGLRPEETVLFKCGICDGSFENSDALKCHMLTTHAGPEETKADEIGTPADNESMENLTLPDLSIERPMKPKETKSTNNPEFENIRTSAAMNGAILLESRDSNIPRTTRRRGRPAKPGQEIEITTASGRRFQCDLCDNIFQTRMIARDHRLGHFATPQIPCYITGCSQMFFSRIQRVNHLKSVHFIRFRKGRPFVGSKRLALKITGPRKVCSKGIIPIVHTARKPSHSPPKIQLNKSPKPDQNIPRRPQTGGLSPEETELFTCGICSDNFENFDTLNCHILTTHAGPGDTLAEELEGIGTPDENSFGSDQSTCEGDQVPAEAKENQATSSPPESFNALMQQQGPAPRYPIVKVGDKKYFYCGFPGCDDVFNNRTSRYAHHKKNHNDAHRSLLTSLGYHPEKKANETSSTELKEQSDEEEKTEDMKPDFPFVQVKGKKYFWCDFPECGVVVTNLEARYLHHKKHQMSSEKTKIAQNSVGPDPMKRKVPQTEPKQLQIKRPKIVETEEEELLGQRSPPNQPEMSEFSTQNDGEMGAQSPMQDDGEMSAQSPTQVLTVVLDQDFEADEQDETSDMQNQSMDTLQFVIIDDDDENPMEHISLFSEDFNTENIVQTDSGLGSELSSEDSASNPALRNISNPTLTKTDKVVQSLRVVKKQKAGGRKPIYAAIQIGSRTLFRCDFPGCGGVFNKRKTLYLHAKRHRMGQKVRPKLKLMENGMVMDSAEGSYVMK